MANLNQVIAVAQGKKSHAKKVEERVYHLFDKPDVFNGLTRKYQPKDDQGESLPPESKNVQFNVDELLKDVNKAVGDMFDVVLQQDSANCDAKADVVVDGQTVATAVPATTLIFLEKQLNDLTALVGRVPTLDLNESWNKDEGKGVYVSTPAETHRTVKKQEALVMYPATAEHPAQTQLITRDEIAGFWKTTKLSGAWTPTKKVEVLDKIRQLKDAVILAREEANKVEVERLSLGKSVLTYIFGNNLV